MLIINGVKLIDGGTAAITGGTIEGTTIGATTPSTVRNLQRVTTHSATENVTAVSMAGDSHIIDGAYTVSLPTAVIGYHGSFMASTAAIAGLDLATGTDVIVLNGTALTAGYKIVSDGTQYAEVYVECKIAGTYHITSVLKVWVDGGA